MVGRALSNHIKAQTLQRVEDMQMQAAINVYLQEQAGLNGSKKQGARPIADAHGVCYRTLLCLAKGSQSMSAFNASKRKLTYAEECVLVDCILESADWAVPLTSKNIETHANTILEFCDTPGEPVGINWVARFLERNQDELQTHWLSPLATERARSLNKEGVKHWFELVHTQLVERGGSRSTIFTGWMKVDSHLQTRGRFVSWAKGAQRFSIRLEVEIEKMSQPLSLFVQTKQHYIQLSFLRGRTS